MPSEKHEESNDIFNYPHLFATGPNSANILLEHRVASAKPGTTSYTYHGPFDVLDHQNDFKNYIDNWEDCYDLTTVPTGKLNIQNRKFPQEKLSKVCNVIQFRFFCYDFRRAYLSTIEDYLITEKNFITH